MKIPEPYASKQYVQRLEETNKVLLKAAKNALDALLAFHKKVADQAFVNKQTVPVWDEIKELQKAITHASGETA